MPHSIKIRGIAPPGLARESEAVRLHYWSLVAEIALRVKDRELAEGLDAHGDPLRAISARTRRYRRTAMTPGGRGDPSAPPLMPARRKSRVRSLLAARAFRTHAELYWRYDPFTGGSFDVILTYQRAQGRDVFGVSPAGMRTIAARARREYAAWLRSGQAPLATGRALPAAALAAGRQSRLARIIAESAEPAAEARAAESAGVGRLDTRWITRGIGAPLVRDLRASDAVRQGGLDLTGLRAHYLAELPRGTGGGRVTPPRPAPTQPQPVRQRAAMRKTPARATTARPALTEAFTLLSRALARLFGRGED